MGLFLAGVATIALRLMIDRPVKQPAVGVATSMTTDPRPQANVAQPAKHSNRTQVVNSTIDDIRKNVANSDDPSLPMAAPPMQQQIRAHVQVLRGESMEQSVAMLSEVEMFYWPGHGEDDSGAISFPLSAEVSSQYVDSILSNRRFLKVFGELSAVPRPQAAQLVVDEIRKTLPDYRALLESDLNKLIQARASTLPGAATSSGLSLYIDNNPDHSPTLAGARLKLLALVMIAGNLHLAEARAAVLDVIAEATSQHTRFAQTQPALTDADRFCILKDASLYQRQILASGLIGCSTNSVPAVRADDLRWREDILPRFDAHATPYDMLTRDDGPIPVDYSKGKLAVRTLEPINETRWTELLHAYAPQLPMQK